MYKIAKDCTSCEPLNSRRLLPLVHKCRLTCRKIYMKMTLFSVFLNLHKVTEFLVNVFYEDIDCFLVFS